MSIPPGLVGGAIFKGHAIAGLVVDADHGSVAHAVVIKVDACSAGNLRIAQ